ncbi:MAG: mechanosensitive ion channel [Henriciella sp.]|nr:mechanosensitive ion channel [Henriciella sp.]
MDTFFEDIADQFELHWKTALTVLVILIVTYIVARLVSWGLRKSIDKLNLESVDAGETPQLGSSIGVAGFWIVILVGLVAALERLGLNQVTEPLNNLLNQVMTYLPNVAGAAILMAVFAILATVVRKASTSVLKFADPMPEKLGLATGDVNISGITGIVLFALLVLTGIGVSLDTLQMPSISEPVGGLIDSVLGAVPNVVVALIILGLFVFIGKFVTDLMRKTLPNTGLDSAVAELGLLKGADSGLTASSLLASVAMFFIVLIGLVQAIAVLEFEILSEYMDVVLSMGAQIAFGAVIIFAGVFIARLVTGAMSATGGDATDTAAAIVKWLIIGLAIILGLSRMGLDPEGGVFVLDVAKLLAMGAAVGLAGAMAIGFGWGGRDWFGRQLEKWQPGDPKPPTRKRTSSAKS